MEGTAPPAHLVDLPYNSDSSPSTSSAEEEPSDSNLSVFVDLSESVQQTTLQSDDEANNLDNSSPICNCSQFDDDIPPPEYTPYPTSSQEIPGNVTNRLQYSQEILQPVRPLRCRSGYVDLGVGNITDVGQICSWKNHYVEVRDFFIFISPSRSKANQITSIPLKDRFIFMPSRRLVAIQGGCHTLVMKASNEVRAHKWLMTLSQYCYVAPMMEGYCEKMSRGKKIFQDRYLRLCSNGVLSWFKSDNEDSERRGSIQLRGERCYIDIVDPRIVHVQVQPKGYQFRYNTPREAQLWLAAFQWHYGRKPLRKAAVPLLNKVK